MRFPTRVSYDICMQEAYSCRVYPTDPLTTDRHLFNRERLMLTSPKALAEVLTTNSYDFVKPRLLREGIGQVLGIGILFAEGDEHKVRLQCCQN
jgi:hypothetical protein